jgi:ABC-type multidrug transport system ATPase subunit/multisubunit Na+/H+ antiporter MnhF subunit
LFSSASSPPASRSGPIHFHIRQPTRTSRSTPSPQYGFIPDDEHTHNLLDAIQNTTLYGDVAGSAIFFSSFDKYKEWIQANREVKEVFYAILWRNSGKLTNPDVLISSNGMTQFPMGDVHVQTIPDLVRTATAAFIANSAVFLDWSKLPTDSVFQTRDAEATTSLIIFSTVFFIPMILTAATNYGAEAESGLRDLFIFFGCSLAANRARWYLECFMVTFFLSIPFAIAIWAWIGISVWLLILVFFLGVGSITSFTFALIVIRPTQAMGRVVGLDTLMAFLIVYFWAAFSWLYTEDGYYEKRILSVLPSASIPYTQGQLIAGHCIDFSELNNPGHYPVRMGLTYMAVEMVVYYVMFAIIDYVKSTKWYRAPFRWGKNKPTDEVTLIEIDWLCKSYGDTSVLKDLSFQVEMGEALAIVGPNGAGKSTLLAILAGALPSTFGEVRFRGLEAARDVECIHRMIGFRPQQNRFMNELNAPEWFHALCVLRGEPDFDYSELIPALGLEQQLESQIGDLSGGNKRKVCLATALLGNPAIVVLDEATAGVDFTSRTRIWSLIAGLKDTTVIMATHTLEECEKIADRIMVLVDGEISALKTPTELRQMFKCGYLIETDKEHEDELRGVLAMHRIDNPEIDITETQAKVVIPAGEHRALTGILTDINFNYLMSIQSLEDKIFSQIQAHEMAALHDRDAARNAEDLHPPA